MKKIAIFLEGETEFDFVRRLIEELASKIDVLVDIKIVEYSQNKTIRSAILTGISEKDDKQFQATLNVSGNDRKVSADIRKNAETLKNRGFQHIIGLKDLKGEKEQRVLTREDLPDVELADKVVEILCRPLRTKIITAVMEIETWFLAETNHFACMANKLTEDFVRAEIENLGFNPYNETTDALTEIEQPTDALKKLYGLTGRSYSKKKRVRMKTINCLDYANLHLNTRNRLTKLDDFLTEIDSFLIQDK